MQLHILSEVYSITLTLALFFIVLAAVNFLDHVETFSSLDRFSVLDHVVSM